MTTGNITLMTATDSKALVLEFLAAWDGRDLDRIMSFFCERSIYHNVPVAPIRGLLGIRTIFEAFLKAFRTATLEVVAVAAEPGLVIAERIDRFEMNDGRQITLPVTGVFVIENDKIARFSDYFDLASFERQSGLKL
jgi:limonene-1,2-epoxide hydrolase